MVTWKDEGQSMQSVSGQRQKRGHDVFGELRMAKNDWYDG